MLELKGFGEQYIIIIWLLVFNHLINYNTPKLERERDGREKSTNKITVIQ